MIIDNKNEYSPQSTIKTAWDFLKKYTGGEQLNIVTGYFTISALSLLKRFNQEPRQFRLILNEIAGEKDTRERIIDLLQENSNLTNVFKLRQTALDAITIIKQDNLEVKRINNEFCHAKTYIYKSSKDMDEDYFLTGSSNFTEKGLGLYDSSNVELNIGHKGGDTSDYKDILAWFERTWETASDKIDLSHDGHKIRKSVKQYFIDCIESFCKEYQPKDIYYKILFELFRDDIDLALESETNRDMTRLEDSIIWDVLFDYQKRGVKSLISMLEKYNGAILADAVGLGKTFSALAVIKYYQSRNYFTLILCPKKLQENWEQYQRHQGSRFENDRFDYEVRFHTDLQGDRLNNYGRVPLSYLKEYPKMLIVIDESHNLRNDKSGRYQFLMEQLLKNRPQGTDLKILELSATPINTHIVDVRNQFKLIAKDDDKAFNVEDLEVPSIISLFRDAQKKISEWNEKEGERRIKDLIESLSDKFINLIDRMVLARTRDMVERATGTSLGFPKKNAPRNIYKAISELGHLSTFEDIHKALMKPKLVAYQPSAYMEERTVTAVTEDQRMREFFLCRMMMILFLKRLESSWVACKKTVENVLDHHKNALQKVNDFIDGKEKRELAAYGVPDIDLPDEDEDDLTLGKKSPIRLKDIKDIQAFKKDLEADVAALRDFVNNMNLYAERFEKDRVKDSKLEDLKEILEEKMKEDKRVLIFTSYSDTAQYLYEQLSKIPAFKNVVAVVDGDGATFKGQHESKFQNTLQRFAPYSKLYKEMDWVGLYDRYFPAKDSHFNVGKQKWEVNFEEWKAVIQDSKDDITARKAWDALNEPIKILIATDCLSEGQNLQDAQTVVNYDVHWNPTRLIQRLGRIDRIGSPNERIDCINFWPAENYETYLRLAERVDERMVAMGIVGTEITPMSEKLQLEVSENPILDRNDKKLLQSIVEPDADGFAQEETFGFQDLSLETFRQDLLDMLRQHEDFYRQMPNGIYTGFKAEDDMFTVVPESLVALVRSKTGSAKHLVLLPINKERQEHVQRDYNRQEILTLLREAKEKSRFVPEKVDKGDAETLEGLSQLLRSWVEERAPQEKKSLISNLLSGAAFSKTAKETKPQSENINESYKLENLELVVWEYISK